MDVRKYDVPIRQPKKLSKKQIDTFNAYSHFGKQSDQIIQQIKSTITNDLLELKKEPSWDYYMFPTSNVTYLVPRLPTTHAIYSKCGKVQSIEFISSEGVGLIATYRTMQFWMGDNLSCRSAYETLGEYIREHQEYYVLRRFT